MDVYGQRAAFRHGKVMRVAVPITAGQLVRELIDRGNGKRFHNDLNSPACGRIRDQAAWNVATDAEHTAAVMQRSPVRRETEGAQISVSKDNPVACVERSDGIVEEVGD